MRYNEIAESQEAQAIMIRSDHGSVEGYVVDTYAINLINWLNKHDINQTMADEIRAVSKTVAILNNINVDDDYRGEGEGSNLFDSFFNKATSLGADAILLIADTNESQEDGFDLVHWYESLDFEVISQTSSGPLMLYRNN